MISLLNLKLNLPVFKDTLTKNIEILSGPLIDSSTVQNGRIKIIQKYLITSFDSGLIQSPPVFAEIKNADGLKRFYSDYSLLEVMRVKIAPADTASKIFDIIKPYRAPINCRRSPSMGADCYSSWCNYMVCCKIFPET